MRYISQNLSGPAVSELVVENKESLPKDCTITKEKHEKGKKTYIGERNQPKVALWV